MVEQTLRQSVLVVDDTPENLALISRLLKQHYQIKVATNGEKALVIANSDPQPDLILLDVLMPGMDGYEVCRRLKLDARTAEIPVVFLTARSDTSAEAQGFELGAVDFLSKPVSPPILLARIETHLVLKNARQVLKDRNATLEEEVRRRVHEIQVVQDVTIMALASLAETRDNETGHHLVRTQLYVQALADHLQGHARFSAELTPSNIELIVKSAPLHDIGKVGVPDRILLKPGRLTPEEFEVMKTHTTLGYRALVEGESRMQQQAPFLRFAKEIALSHQEKWDGSGYPNGLAGEVIPISARLMALADVYDALISRRVYKPAMSHEQAYGLIVAGSGLHFDPDIVAAFIAEADNFNQIAQRFSDTEAQHEEEQARVLRAMGENA